MNIPTCPQHGPMKLIELSEDDRVLGRIWFCVKDDEGKPDYCDECADYDPAVHGNPEQYLKREPTAQTVAQKKAVEAGQMEMQL